MGDGPSSREKLGKTNRTKENRCLPTGAGTYLVKKKERGKTGD